MAGNGFLNTLKQMVTKKDKIDKLINQLRQLDSVDVKLFNLFSSYTIHLKKPALTPFKGSVTVLACELEHLFKHSETPVENYFVSDLMITS